MPDSDSIDTQILEERLAGLRSWLAERFQRLDDRLDAMCDQREEDQAHFIKLEAKVLEDHEERLVRLERLAWAAVGIAAFFSPVVVWAIIEIIKQVV